MPKNDARDLQFLGLQGIEPGERLVKGSTDRASDERESEQEPGEPLRRTDLPGQAVEPSRPGALHMDCRLKPEGTGDPHEIEEGGRDRCGS